MVTKVKNFLKTSLYLTGVFNLLNYHRQYSCRRFLLLVINYHRVTSHTDDRYLPGINPAIFRRQLRYLKRYFIPLAPQDLAGQLTGKDFPSAIHFLITFDDGLREQYQIAYPILREEGISAIFFVPSNISDEPFPLWMTELAHQFSHLPTQKIYLQFAGDRVDFLLEPKEERLKSFNRLKEKLKQIPNGERRRILADLKQQYPVPAISADSPYTVITRSEARQMLTAGMVFGSHSRSHPILSRLTTEQKKEEIIISRQELAETIAAPVDFFAYPNGLPADYDQECLNLVAQAGYRAAFTNQAGVNRLPEADPFTLSRIDGGNPYFARWVASLTSGLRRAII